MLGNCTPELGGARISGLYDRREESVLEAKLLSSVQGLLSLGPLWDVDVEINRHDMLASNTNLHVQGLS